MTKRILIPLDGSLFAERILAYLANFDQAKNLDLVLVNVLESSRYYSTFGSESLITYDLSYWREQAEEYLRTKAGELRELGYTVRTRLLEGDVATAVTDLADASDVDLIAMTTHGRSGITRWVMGSVAERILHAARQPVFLVRPGTDVLHVGAKTIVVPLDGSSLAEGALAVANEFAGPGDRLLLVSAVEHQEYWVEADVNLHVPPVVKTIEQQEQMAAEYLEKVAQKLRKEGRTVDTAVQHGPAAESIVEMASQHDAAMIVMTTHGRTGISRWMFGSVAAKVVRSAECPVLVVRGHKDTPAPDPIGMTSVAVA